jgi:putative two-component system response regulator
LFERIEHCLKGESSENEDDKTEKPVIVAVDDAPDVLKAVHSMLRDTYKVYTIPKPEKLQDVLNKTTPQLFLLDYQMPIISGFDLISLIREHPNHKDTPIIFLTSEGTVDNLTAAVHYGVCDFIVKPVDNDILREKVAKHLANK